VLDDPRCQSRPRCAFAGLGCWGRRLLARVAPSFEIVALVGTGRPESIAWSVRNYPDVPYLDTLTDALALPALDAVFLATPTPTHAELASQALEAGCHVFVEKPLAVDTRDAIRVLAEATKRDLEVFIGYVYLFHPGLDFLRAVAPPLDVESLQFDWVRPQLTGKLHEELLCHDLAVSIALTGELPHQVEVLEYDRTTLRCVIELPSGRACRASMRAPDNGEKSKAVDVRYVGGRAYTWRDNQVADLTDPRTNLLTPAVDDPLSREVAAFRRAIDGTGPRMTTDRCLSVGISGLLSEAFVPATPHHYAIAAAGSRTTAEQFQRHCDQLGLRARPVRLLTTLVPDSAEACFEVDESYYDAVQLKRLSWERLVKSHVRVELGCTRQVRALRQAHDVVVVTAYGSLNQVLAELGCPTMELQYEVCEVPVIHAPRLDRCSVVVMDGPFMSVAPYATGLHLLYDVVHSVHTRTVGHASPGLRGYAYQLGGPPVSHPACTRFASILSSTQRFVAPLADVRHVGSLFAERIVLPGVGETDARPTEVRWVTPCVICVLLGKVSVAIDAGRTVAGAIAGKLGLLGTDSK
jgi:predicted dehydrogenase